MITRARGASKFRGGRRSSVITRASCCRAEASKRAPSIDCSQRSGNFPSIGQSRSERADCAGISSSVRPMRSSPLRRSKPGSPSGPATSGTFEVCAACGSKARADLGPALRARPPGPSLRATLHAPPGAAPSLGSPTDLVGAAVDPQELPIGARSSPARTVRTSPESRATIPGVVQQFGPAIPPDEAPAPLTAGTPGPLPARGARRPADGGLPSRPTPRPQGGDQGRPRRL